MSVHDAVLGLPVSGTLNVKRLERQFKGLWEQVSQSV